MEEKYFAEAERLALVNSTCLKIKTGAVIVKKGKTIGRGWNLCSPEGFKHGQKVGKCPRFGLKTGENYELCKPIHAEVMAILNTGLKNCRGATMYLSGHWYACWHCQSLAYLAGIKEIKVKDKKTKNF